MCFQRVDQTTAFLRRIERSFQVRRAGDEVFMENSENDVKLGNRLGLRYGTPGSPPFPQGSVIRLVV